jgi:DNA-binding MarR family transcriptional regulator
VHARREPDDQEPRRCITERRHRAAIVIRVARLYVVEEADFVFLSDRTGLTAGNISSHMSKLEAASYVEVSKTFVDRRPRTVYRLTDRGRRALEQHRVALDGLFGAVESS